MAAERYVDFGGRRGKIITAGGPYKSWRKPEVVRLIPEVVWYCVGDSKEIRRLLASITHIGGRRGSGCGLVREWVVEPWPHDWSEYGPQGELMRPIPDPDGIEETAIRPPYWSPRNWRVCRCGGGLRCWREEYRLLARLPAFGRLVERTRALIAEQLAREDVNWVVASRFGKDSITMLDLILGQRPDITVYHMDSGYCLPELYQTRDWFVRERGIRLEIKHSDVD